MKHRVYITVRKLDLCAAVVLL